MACEGPFARGTGGGCNCCKCCPPPSCDEIKYSFQLTKNNCSSSSSSSMAICKCAFCVIEGQAYYYDSYLINVTGLITNSFHGGICCCEDMNGEYLLKNKYNDGCGLCWYQSDEEGGECGDCNINESGCPAPSSPKWILNIFLNGFSQIQATLINVVGGPTGSGCGALSADDIIDADICDPSFDLTWFSGPGCAACIASGPTSITVTGVGSLIPCEIVTPMSPEMQLFVKELAKAGPVFLPVA